MYSHGALHIIFKPPSDRLHAIYVHKKIGINPELNIFYDIKHKIASMTSLHRKITQAKHLPENTD